MTNSIPDFRVPPTRRIAENLEVIADAMVALVELQARELLTSQPIGYANSSTINQYIDPVIRKHHELRSNGYLPTPSFDYKKPAGEK